LKIYYHLEPLTRPFPRPLIRFPFAARLVNAIAFVETLILIASAYGVAARVRTRKNAGKLSWRRAAFINYSSM
jgi:hypothetical protein